MLGLLQALTSECERSKLSDNSENEDINSEEIITEEMLWERIPEVQGLDRANT